MEPKNSLTQEFCEYLEYHLCDTFRNASDKTIRSLWCDGIAWHDVPAAVVNENKALETTAWIGQDGQDEYFLKINLGACALKNIAEGLGLIDCIPSADSMDWVSLDIQGRRIEIQLK